jgi:glutaconate CoA-transferase, subunit B
MTWSAAEMMTVAAARGLRGATTCFVGIGLPGAAANLARRVHSPDLALVYESGALSSKPDVLPLSIGDGSVGATADAIVTVPEIFNYWVQPGRIDVGLLGAAQIDRFGNINTTVIGSDYARPEVRLPGGGGAPEIAASCHRVIVIMRHRPRALVERVDFITSVGYGAGAGHRERLGLRGRGPVKVITDIGILEPDPRRCELQLTYLHPGCEADDARAATNWPLRVAANLQRGAPPTERELTELRRLLDTRSRDDENADTQESNTERRG